MEPAEAFALIRNHCWRGNRSLVPLFGAGISVDAGIPLLTPILEYLVRVSVHISLSYCGVGPSEKCPADRIDLIRDSKKYHDWIAERGWPDRHEITEIQLGQFDSLSIATLQDIVVTKLGVVPGSGLWRTILDLLTNSDSALVDMFFSSLMRDARPGAAHQYTAFLTHIMNMKLILTTNFDPLLERALQDQDLDVVNFELNNSEHWPDPKLVSSQRSIIQMHGGAFALLAGAILDVPLDYRRKRLFLDYIDPEALMLVVGYGGQDARVRNIIDTHAARHKGPGDWRVLWLQRSPATHEKDSDGIAYVPYYDGAQFLRELHDRLTTSHPVSRLWYSAFNHVPPRRVDPQEQILSTVGCSKVVIYCREVSDFGTSAALAQHVHEVGNLYDVIWCHLESLPTIDSFFAFLQREFRRRDSTFPPFAMFRSRVPSPPRYRAQSTTATEQNVASSGSGGENVSRNQCAQHIDWENDPRPRFILRAMRRGKYLIAIDSLGEFGDHISTGMGIGNERRPPDPEREYAELTTLLDYLIANSGKFGESRLAIGASPQRDLNWAKDFALANADIRDVRTLSVVPPVNVGVKTNPGCFTDESWKDIEPRLSGWDEQLRKLKAPPDRRDIVQTIVKTLFQALRPSTQVVLALAITFRRFRSIVALRQILIPLWNKLDQGIPALAEADLNSSPEPVTEQRRERTEQLDQLLEGLNAMALLVRQEGGFYWMHRVVRKAVYDWCSETYRDSFGALQSALHDRLATYYRNLFASSHDRTTLVEYLYHRYQTLSTRDWANNIAAYRARLCDLDTTLSLERDKLLSQRYSDTLLAWVGSFRDLLAEVKQPLQARSQDREFVACGKVWIHLMATLCDLKAEALRQKHDLFRCLEARFEQISHRLGFPGKGIPTDAEYVQAPTGADDPTTATYWEHYQTEFREVHARYCTPADFDKGRLQLRSVIELACARKLPEFAVRNWCAVEPQSTRTADSVTNGYRLLEELIDVAYCASSLDLEKTTNSAVPVLEESPYRLMTQIHDATTGHIQSAEGPQSHEELNRARRILIRCSFRRIEHVLRPLTLWNHEEHRRTIQERRDLVRKLYDEGTRTLREFSGVEQRDFMHYACFLNTLLARNYYLEHDFVAAYRHLEQAEAAIALPATGSERSALAVCQLYRVECLIGDADYQFSAEHPKQIQNDDDAQRVIGRADEWLERAMAGIQRARNLLDQGRPHVQWWSKSYWLEAQCCHEQLILRLLRYSCVESAEEGVNASKGAVDDQEDRRRRLQEFEDLLRRALTCISLIHDTARQDDRRVQGAEVLSHQLYILHRLLNLVLATPRVNRPDRDEEDSHRSAAAFPPSPTNGVDGSRTDDPGTRLFGAELWARIVPKPIGDTSMSDAVSRLLLESNYVEGEWRRLYKSAGTDIVIGTRIDSCLNQIIAAIDAGGKVPSVVELRRRLLEDIERKCVEAAQRNNEGEP